MQKVLEKKPGNKKCETNSVADEAYYLAEKRGFQPGGELQDWLAAEHLVHEKHSDQPKKN
jgi:hypothetical protein